MVENYALKERTQDELRLLERVKMNRRIEIHAQKTRAELTAEIMKRDNIHELVSFGLFYLYFVVYPRVN